MTTVRERFHCARLDELGVLVEIADSGSLSAAARKLGVPKSTVGRAIRGLEEDLELSLVRRMSRGQVLTKPGRIRAYDNVVFFPSDTAEYELRGPNGVAKVKVPGRVSGDDFFFVREALVAGVGIGALPWFMASPELSAGRLVRVLPEHQAMRNTMYLVYPPVKPLPSKIAAFTTFLREHAPRLLGPA
ncbi:MAG: LysR family transcriptional regulator [Deltaproteobacteria bacterium]|nr:LysR family transcriptional regulator [Nannocystaceae bacterium]